MPANEQTGQPELLAATDPECGYAWAIAEGLQHRGEALLLQAAQLLDSKYVEPCLQCGRQRDERALDRAVCHNCSSIKNKVGDLAVAIENADDSPERITQWGQVRHWLRALFGQDRPDSDLWSRCKDWLKAEYKFVPEEYLQFSLDGFVHLLETRQPTQEQESLRGIEASLNGKVELLHQSRVLVSQAREVLNQAMESWQPLHDPEPERLDQNFELDGKSYNYRAAKTHRVLSDLADGVLTRYPLTSRRILTKEPLMTAASIRRFDIALSFPGERREFVEGVAEHLSATLHRDRVLYDKYYEAEFARLDLDVYLPRLYREQSELVVAFLCPDYQQKRWCQLEWRHIRQLIATAEAGRIMLVSFGSPGDLSEIGILSGDGYVNIGARDPATIASLILQKYGIEKAVKPLQPDGTSKANMTGFTLAFVTYQAVGPLYDDDLSPHRDVIRTYRARIVSAAAGLNLCSGGAPSDEAGRALINWLVANRQLTYSAARDLSVDDTLRIIADHKQLTSKHAEVANPTILETRMTRCKVLFLAANPLDCEQLDLAEEARDIEQRIRQAKHRDVIDFLPKFAARRADLQYHLLNDQPHVLHISGHGSKQDEIELKGDDGNASPVSKAGLRAMLKAVKDNIRLVVLNACYTGRTADSITEVIDCAIGMKRGIGDEAARVFAASFYLAIGFGRSVQNAFDQAVASLQVMGISEDKTPVLSCRDGIDANKVFLVEPELSSPNPG